MVVMMHVNAKPRTTYGPKFGITFDLAQTACLLRRIPNVTTVAGAAVHLVGECKQGPQREKVGLDDVVVLTQQSGIGVQGKFESSQLTLKVRPGALNSAERLVTAVDKLLLPIDNFHDVEAYGSVRRVEANDVLDGARLSHCWARYRQKSICKSHKIYAVRFEYIQEASLLAKQGLQKT